jgi:hypothetical protein
VFNGSCHPLRISISARPPVQADSTDSAEVAAIAGSVWVASLIAPTMLAIGVGSMSTGNAGVCADCVSGIGSPSNRFSFSGIWTPWPSLYIAGIRGKLLEIVAKMWPRSRHGVS